MKKYKLLGNDMKAYGYTSSDIEQITSNPSVSKMNEDFLVTAVSNLFKILTSLGFENEEIITISKKIPELLTLDPNHVNQTISCMLKKMRYTEENIKTMITRFPRILYLTEESMVQKMNRIINLGYDSNELKDFTVNFPILYILTIENIEDKAVFFNSVGLHKIFLSDKAIMQSVELSYAIYMFFKSIGIDINIGNSDWLFQSESFFKEQYGKSFSQLMEEYPYNTDVIKRRH